MVRCPRCGSENDNSWKTCSNCGSSLAVSRAATEYKKEKEYESDYNAEMKRQGARARLERAAEGTRGEGVIELPGEVPPPPTRLERTGVRARRDFRTIVGLEKGARTTINLKIKSRLTEAVIICAAGVAMIVFLNQNWLGAGLFLLAFYMFLPNESDVMNEAREAVEKQLKEERKKDDAQELQGEAQKAYESEKGKLRAQREYNR